MWIEEFGDTDDLVFYLFCAVGGVILLLSVINFFLGCCLKGYSGASSIDFYIVLGAFILACTECLRVINVKRITEDEVKIYCQFYPAVLLVGLTMFIGGLMVKSWGIWLYTKYNHDKKPLTEEWKPNFLIWILIIIIAAVSVVWCIQYTPTSVPIVGTTNTTVTYGCQSTNDYEWKVVTSVWHGFLLLLAAIAIFPICASVKNSEGTIIAIVTLNSLFAVVAGICVHSLYKTDDVTVKYAIKGGLMLWMCLFANIMLIISKVTSNRRSKGTLKQGDNYDTINSDHKGNQNSGYMEPTESVEAFQY